MDRDHNQLLQIFKKIQGISQIQLFRKLQYRFNFAPELKKGHYKDFMFKVVVKFHKDYPKTPPAIYFIDKPYHLNIDPQTGKFNAAFLLDQWFSYITLDMIFEEIKSILEKPQLKSATCPIMKKMYQNQISAYQQKIIQFKNRKNSSYKDQCTSPKSKIPISSTFKKKYRNQQQAPLFEQEYSKDTIKEFLQHQYNTQNKRSRQSDRPTIKRKNTSPLFISQPLKIQKRSNNKIGKKQIHFINQSQLFKVYSSGKNSLQSQIPINQRQLFENDNISQIKVKQIQKKQRNQFQRSQQSKNNINISSPGKLNRLNSFQKLKIQTNRNNQESQLNNKVIQQKTARKINNLNKINISDKDFNDANNKAVFLNKKSGQNIFGKIEVKGLNSQQKQEEIKLSSEKINQNLKKVNFYIEIFMNECQYIENQIKLTGNMKIKQILQKKLQSQGEFIQRLQDLSSKLKKKIVNNLAVEVQFMI